MAAFRRWHFQMHFIEWKYVWIFIKISMKFIPMGLITNIPTLDKFMAWHQPGDRPLSEANDG